MCGKNKQTHSEEQGENKYKFDYKEQTHMIFSLSRIPLDKYLLA